MLPFQSHSDTSRKAAAAFLPKAKTARERVFRAIESSERGLTDEEIQDLLSMPANTQRPRRVELDQAGIIEDSGTTRKTSAGVEAVVWVATGEVYPVKWFSKTTGPDTGNLSGDEKAIAEIKFFVPEARRSSELTDLLQRLELFGVLDC